MWKIWILVSGLFVIFEMMTVGFLVFWFAVGAIVAMIVSFITDNIIIQTAFFLVSSTLLILFTRPLVDKFVKKDFIPTNADSIIGRKAIVTKEINADNAIGQIKIGGETWSAKSKEGNTYEKGSEVEVVSIDGVKAIIK